MFSYWFAAVRRSAPAAVAVTLLLGSFVAGALIADDPADWTAALLRGVGVGAVAGAVFVCVANTSSTFHAVRAAARHGLTLDARAAGVPSVRRLDVPVAPGTTAYRLTDAVLHALKQLPAPRVGEVTEFTHGRLALTYGPVGGVDVALRVTITTQGGSASVDMEARPVSRWKKLDGGASWSTLAAVEPAVRRALVEETL
ncbi:hypothetical protein [Streptomyces seoulensis]|uniref:hypothetical protein n=1 Tax=Streptomyces seoulensis TaxID=73044 RepID=UPI001FCB5AEA|nr:hypothetical protein [Streptomyces seoulensis]BDH07712.1 hypothetical protein HEK131_49390 [Streptomyces seoulensis]